MYLVVSVFPFRGSGSLFLYFLFLVTGVYLFPPFSVYSELFVPNHCCASSIRFHVCLCPFGPMFQRLMFPRCALSFGVNLLWCLFFILCFHSPRRLGFFPRLFPSMFTPFCVCFIVFFFRFCHLLLFGYYAGTAYVFLSFPLPEISVASFLRNGVAVSPLCQFCRQSLD